MKTVLKVIVLCFMAVFSLTSCSKSKSSSAKKIVLSENWKVQQSSKILEDGASISSVKVDSTNWYSATVPSTVMGVLTANGLYADIFVGDNYKTADKTPFDESWWYKTEFDLPKILPENSVFASV